MANDVFQLTVVSQNDPQCAAGAQLSVVVEPPTGGGTLNPGSFPVSESVPLPIPPAPGSSAPPSPTWFLAVGDGIATAQYTLTVSGGPNPTPITVNGADVQKWAAENVSDPTNQVYLEAACGIFGYAQSNPIPGGTQWIYTVTAGVAYPVVHFRG